MFLVIVLIAALFGFAGIDCSAWERAKIVFFNFLIRAVLAFVGALSPENGGRSGKGNP